MYLTNEEVEVEAMIELKEFYKLTKNWQGDPCAPKDRSCLGRSGMNLASDGLYGEISTSLENFKQLKSFVEGNPHLCYKLEECERNSSKKTVIAIFAVVFSVIVVLLIVFLVWKVKNRTPTRECTNLVP
ncbi:hypothetical protein ZOSMA_2G01510 [Zostera marina]|uniref:Uncharacterized protein n=1 Tax=Zostera marina TaxID=29655 RepID=A0A0K9PB05_ZOSMR|nr:hypothetical protein ZOSMA_2G01510 [Zostera marina]